MAHYLEHMLFKGTTERPTAPEISEAIDFCRYYATAGSARLDQASASGCVVEGRGVVVVVGPWNFPYAIPTGGVAAAIATPSRSHVVPPSSERSTRALTRAIMWF